VSEEGFVAPFGDDDATHQVVDRPLRSQMSANRNYVQPQWVFDCVNTGILLPVEDYLPGQELPPHLSPFVNDQQEGYVPDQRKRLDSLIARANSSEIKEMTEETEESAQAAAIDLEKKYQEELEKETKGISYSEAAEEKTPEPVAAVIAAAEEKEIGEDELASIMIPSKKKRRLYQRIQYSEKQKKRKVETLEEKKKALVKE
jgi:pescadillo protein